jgi:hypothetical protein
MAWVGKFDRAVHTGNGKHQRELFVESASRNCEEALRLFEQASRKDPENADLWFLRGAALAIIAWSIRKGRYQERRLLLRRLGDFRDRAMTALANAVRLAPANPRYHFLSGNVEEAIRLEPTNELYDVPNSPGRDLPWRGGWDIGALDESIAEDPRFAAAWFTAFRLELYKQRGPFRVYT